MSKKHNPKKEIEKHAANILFEIRKWKYIKEFGCNDPFWPDGVNMNLIRNHIIYAKKEMARICHEECIPLAEAYYSPTPPEVDNNYMANLKGKRAERIKQQGDILTRRRITYNENQTELLP